MVATQTCVWPPRRSRLLRVLVYWASAGEKMGLGQRLLEPERIIQRARRRSRVRDIPVDDIREPLELLARCFREEAGLSPLGRQAMDLLLGDTLANRLQILDFLRRHPEIDRVPVEAPVFILGLPRSGSTLLHHLLAELPGARPPLAWEIGQLVPPEPAGSRPDPRPRRGQQRLAVLNRLVPELKQLHESRWDSPEESIPLLNNSFSTRTFFLGAQMPSYEQWLEERSAPARESVYRFFKRQVQLLLWQRCPERGFWLEKAPAHLDAMEALVRVFPDVRIVNTHRHLGRVVPSAASMGAILHNLSQLSIDGHSLGQWTLQLMGRRAARCLAFRGRFPADRVVDVDFVEFIRDPKRTVHRIVDYFGLPAPADLDQRLDRRLALMPRHKHGVHHYSLARFGLTPADIEAAGAQYHAYFNVSPEPLPTED